MQQDKKVYVRLRHRLQVKMDQTVRVSHICQLIVHPSIEQEVKQLTVHKVTPEDKHLVVIDIMRVIRILKSYDPELEIETLGPAQAIIEIMHPRKQPTFLLVGFVWLLLFIGSGLAIMNFHEDVSMLQVHQKIYMMITGVQEEHPLILQVPYSLGIGVGMILFFNHVFKKRLNEEPSPLEVEMFLYQQSLDQYVVINENKEAQKKVE
ncbi:stage V sporulation protein AA [Caldalkalibacillus salinus]|uniref:stage V sporulation protein AA n=1 Tax=Caldalkalibacillus salinus TaxID=2803787 RepID=UPI001924CD1B|nr:stage V sporulation protein AA [Caldalkalibacillus salinus]